MRARGKTRMLALAILSLAAATAMAQTAEEKNVPADPFSWLYLTYEADARFGAGGPPEESGEVDIREAEFSTTVLFRERGNWKYALGAGLKWDQFGFSDIDLEDLDVYTITLPVDVVCERNPWSFWGNVTPGLFSDMEDVGGDDYRTLAYALGMYRWKPDLRLALGAGYDRVFGEDRVYPIGGATWAIGKAWKLDLLFPMPRVTYAPSRKFLVFADARPAGDVWNVTDEEGGEDIEFSLEGYRLALGLECEIAPHVWFHLAAGVSVDRNYELGEGDRTLLKAKGDDTTFARAGLVVR